MDTKELERFCPWAREELVGAVGRGMVQLGVDGAGRAQWPAGSEAVAGRALSPAEREARDAALARIEAAGDDAAFAEREAYSWFNRLMALRYMELHGLLPWGGRALSAADGSFEPELARRAADLPLARLDRAAYLDRVAASDDEGAFRLALEAACAELAGALPGVFAGASCALLPKGLLSRGEHGVIRRLVEDVPEGAWEDVEALGWAYQFYNSERKADFFKSKRKAAAEDIAPATQLFTPDWIVRYMVQNSLGRLWMLNNPGSPLREQMEFYIEPDEGHEDFLRVGGPEEITFLDPACGSGHILVYAFRLLAEMYRERGWRDRDIARSILEKNLSGYEIDPRAAQIAQTALCMEALALDRRWLARGVAADVRVLQNIGLDEEQLPETHIKRELADEIRHLGEVGSLLDPDEADLAALDAAIADAGASDLLGSALRGRLQEAREQLGALSRRFDVVVANPPYMGSSSFNPFVAKWIKKRYPDSCRDLCTAFTERGTTMVKGAKLVSMVTASSWMFISSFEKFRKKLLSHARIATMIQQSTHGFPYVTVPTTMFTLQVDSKNTTGCYIRLEDFDRPQWQEPRALEAIKNPGCGWFYRADASTFRDIPGSPIAYWASEAVLRLLQQDSLESVISFREGITTGDNDRFLRLWFEVGADHFYPTSTPVASQAKQWIPCNKGGSYRRWYGNRLYSIDWTGEGRSLKNYPGCSFRNADVQRLEGGTYSNLSSGMFSTRFSPSGTAFESKGGSYFGDDYLKALIYMNSSIFAQLVTLLCPTLDFKIGQLKTIPFLDCQESGMQIGLDCIQLSKADWDSQETSWDFKRNPLV